MLQTKFFKREKGKKVLTDSLRKTPGRTADIGERPVTTGKAEETGTTHTAEQYAGNFRKKRESDLTNRGNVLY